MSRRLSFSICVNLSSIIWSFFLEFFKWLAFGGGLCAFVKALNNQPEVYTRNWEIYYNENIVDFMDLRFFWWIL